MEYLATLWTAAWPVIERGNEYLGKVTNYAIAFTLAGVALQLFGTWRSLRLVTVYASNGDSPATPKERFEIARLPRRLVSRAEVNGLIGQAGGEKRLDLTRFKFDYNFKNEVVIELPAESYYRAKRALSGEDAGAEQPRPACEETHPELAAACPLLLNAQPVNHEQNVEQAPSHAAS